LSSVNPITREVLLKVVYYGPGLGGKTTSLQHIHVASKPEHRGKMVSLATPVDRTLYFDFLPVRLPKIRGYTIRLQLFTVPGQVYYNATRKLVLTGADGVVFVADSQKDRLEANVESLDNLHENLREHGNSLEAIPHVLQYNKRDLPSAAPIDDMNVLLNRLGAPALPTVATTGEGVFESLDAITRAVLADLRAKRVLWADDEPGERAHGFDAPRDEGIIQSLLKITSSPPAPTTGDRPTPVSPTPPAAAAPPAAVAVAGVTLGALFAPDEAEFVRSVEAALATGHSARALDLIEPATTRELASAVASLGEGAPRDPSTAALLLGLDGRRYLRFRTICRKHQGGGAVDPRDAAFAWLVYLDVRLRRAGL